MHKLAKNYYDKILEANANDMHTREKSEYLAGFWDACVIMSEYLINLEDAILENKLLTDDPDFVSIVCAPLEQGHYELMQAIKNAKERKENDRKTT